MLALIAMYILFSALLVPYNIATEQGPITVTDGVGTDDLEADEPILEGKEGAISRNTVFVEFGMVQGFCQGEDQSSVQITPWLGSRSGSKTLISLPIRWLAVLFDPYSTTDNANLGNDEDFDEEPAMSTTGKISVPKDRSKYTSKHGHKYKQHKHEKGTKMKTAKGTKTRCQSLSPTQIPDLPLVGPPRFW